MNSIRPVPRCLAAWLLLALLLPLAGPLTQMGAACCQVRDGRCCCPRPVEGRCFTAALPCGPPESGTAAPAPALLHLALLPRTLITWPRPQTAALGAPRASELPQADTTPPDPPPRLLI